MTAQQLDILQHSLGLDKYGRGTFYRNYFCAGGTDVLICQQLVALGYMKEHPNNAVFADPYFSVSDAGKKAVRDESPAPPKMTRAQARYQRYLDADSGVPFREWIASAEAKK